LVSLLPAPPEVMVLVVADVGHLSFIGALSVLSSSLEVRKVGLHSTSHFT